MAQRTISRMTSMESHIAEGVIGAYRQRHREHPVRYRATLCRPIPDQQAKPVSILSNSLQGIEEWAAKVLEGAGLEVWVRVDEQKYEFLKDIREVKK